MRYLLYLAVFLFAHNLSAQKKGYDFVKAEMDSRRLVYTKPDSARIVIKKTLSQTGNIHDTIYGNTYCLYGMYYGMTGRADSAVYYLKKSLNYLDRFPKNKARSLMNLAMAHRNRGDYNISIDYINDLLVLQTKENNQVGIAMAYGELASNYNYMLDYNKSVKYLVDAIAILKEHKKFKHLPPLKQKLANTYMVMNNFKFAIDLYRESLKGFKEESMLKNYYLTHINLADALTHINNHEQAKLSLNEALGGLKQFGDKALIGMAHAKLGFVLDKQKNYAGAAKEYEQGIALLSEVKSDRVVRAAADYIKMLNGQKNYKKSLQVIAAIEKLKLVDKTNQEDRQVYKNAMADAYDATENDAEALKAYKHTIAIMDSVSMADKMKAIGEIQAKFQTELQREKNIALQANNKVLQKNHEADQNRLLMYGIGVAALLIVILLVLRAYWLQTRLQKERLKTVEAENGMLEQRHLHEQELSNAQRETIEEKQRELTSTALRMANYQDSVAEIVNKCDNGRITKITEVKKELQQLAKQEDYWKQFETRFNNLHPEFGTTLINKFGRLTKNDIEFCSLLKLNLSNKEIASLLQISHESVITKKYRIKKKMEINDDDEFERLLTEI